MVLHVTINQVVKLMLWSFKVTVGAAMLVADQHHHSNSKTNDSVYPNCNFGRAK
jgi:hypothetical protein